MAVPSTETASPSVTRTISPEEHSRQLVQALQERLLSDEHALIVPSNARPLFSNLLRSRQSATTAGSSAEVPEEPVTRSQHSVLARLEEIIVGMEALKNMAPSTSVPVGVLSPQEWDALVDVCILDKDGEAMEKTLELMKVCSSRLRRAVTI
jgi:hypothetical protein